ncbi:J domain-containing protein [Candidatus Entotheonella palauensis]|uniref:J domain-containing protein n=1 Tax=Candidatus Entotheonella gemina TaxID=1429439 RepID=W4L4M8_9BACT|nr:J domain-containing protein [Candidatus Entotheonella palauensis]ETW93063.1 MAG: hypothetical protein ETSY2_52075 [Candidatus Entotheonella gemina]
MSALLQRLLNIARSHLHDFIDPFRPDYTIPPYWDIDEPEPEEPYGHNHDNRHRNRAGGTSGSDSSGASSARHHREHGLPYSTELAHCYDLLDLPFGAPMDEVNKRWKSYLKRCHPDLFANDPVRQAEATELSQALMGAQSKIEAAWKRYQPSSKSTS